MLYIIILKQYQQKKETNRNKKQYLQARIFAKRL